MPAGNRYAAAVASEFTDRVIVETPPLYDCDPPRIDFAGTRNRGLGLITGDWRLVTDADEVLQDAMFIREAVAHAQWTGLAGVGVRAYTRDRRMDAEARCPHDWTAAKLMPNSAATRPGSSPAIRSSATRRSFGASSKVPSTVQSSSGLATEGRSSSSMCRVKSPPMGALR